MNEQESLKSALQYEHLDFLPKEYKGRGSWIWIRAICKVTKADTTKSWAVYEYDGVEYSVVCDFGTSSVIRRIESVHPTKWLSPKEIPTFHNPEQCANYLCQLSIHPSETYRLMAEDPIKLRQLVFLTAVKLSQQRADFWRKYKSRPHRRKFSRKK